MELVTYMLKRILYFSYLFLLVYFVWLLPGEAKPYVKINFIPLETIQLYLTALIHDYAPVYVIIGNLIGNIVLFIPIGILLFHHLRHLGIIVIIFFSLYIPVYIEVVQYMLHLAGYGTRSIDVDDVLLNMLGIWIGYLAATIVKATRSK